jgi:flagellar capping protein FliD
LFKGARSYVVDTDTLGNYILQDLPSGSYFVFALPLGNYAPAYYSNDTANTHWKRASKVVVNGNTAEDINIYVHQLPLSVSGYAGINGKISTKGSTSTGIPGAVVYATKNNQIAGYTISGTSGAYTIDGLAPGKYSVSVDNLGSDETGSSSVSISYTGAGAPNDATANFSLDQTATNVAQEITASQPSSFELAQNYPNPFNPSTTIRYTLASSGPVSLKVYNLLGQEIATLANGFQKAGIYQVEFNGKGIASGIYFYRLHSQSTDLTRKMIFLQ